MTNLITVAAERGLVESPRWHAGRLWFADWTADEILTLSDDGGIEVAAKAAAPSLSLDFDGKGGC
jgi:sugar lactone lactonase YvrE